MGNAPFISTFFSFSPIETIFFWARQMFGATEQKLNEYVVQMAETKKKTLVDKVETKRKQSAFMADIRIIILETRIYPVTAPTSVFPVASPAPTFTFFTERREVFPKIFIYHGVKKEFQPWYFQIRAKF